MVDLSVVVMVVVKAVSWADVRVGMMVDLWVLSKAVVSAVERVVRSVVGWVD